MKVTKECFTSIKKSKLTSRASTKDLKESIESTGILLTGRAGQVEAKRSTKEAMARPIGATLMTTSSMVSLDRSLQMPNCVIS